MLTGFRKILKTEVFLVLYAICCFIEENRKNYSLNASLNGYKDFYLRNLEENINHNIFIAVEKNCHFKIFDNLLGTENFNIYKIEETNKNQFKDRLNSRLQRRFVKQSKLTDMYLNNEVLPPENFYVLFSPFINKKLFQGSKHFYHTYTFKGCITGNIKKIFFEILGIFIKSGVKEFKNEIVDFEKESTKDYDLIKFKLEGCGSFMKTYYKEDNEKNNKEDNKEDNKKNNEKNNKLFNRLLELESKYHNKNCKYSEFLNDITLDLINILSENGIFKEKLDLEMYPDVIPLIFPNRIFEFLYNDKSISQLVTIGFDLGKCLNSELAFLFDKQKVEKMIQNGEVWYETFIWNHPLIPE